MYVVVENTIPIMRKEGKLMKNTFVKVLMAAVPIIAAVAQIAAEVVSEKKQEELINRKVDEKVNQILNKKES